VSRVTDSDRWYARQLLGEYSQDVETVAKWAATIRDDAVSADRLARKKISRDLMVMGIIASLVTVGAVSWWPVIKHLVGLMPWP
jgi:hypothetical protein